MDSTSQNRLQPIPTDAVAGVGDSESCVDVILIRGLGTPKVESWSIVRQEAQLLRPSARSYLLRYEYEIASDSNFSWKKSKDEGKCLSECIRDRISSVNRPIISMSHSSSGYMVKEASISASIDSQDRSILDSIAALVFMGCPHLGKDLESKAVLILRMAKIDCPKQTLSRLEKEATLSRSISEQYDQESLRIRTLSSYERNATTIENGRLKGSRFVVLVDEGLAKINDRLIGSKKDHQSSCHWINEQGGPHTDVSTWIQDAIDGALVKRSTATGSSPSAAHSSGPYYPQSQGKITFPIRPTVDPAALECVELIPSINGHTISESKESTSDSAHYGSQCPYIKKCANPNLQADLPCFMVETRLKNRDFCERNDLLQTMEEALSPRSGTGGRQVTLHGLPGVGKSEAAIEFVFRHRHDFDAIFWVRADSAPKSKQDLVRIASHLGLEIPSKHLLDPIVSRDVVGHWSRNPARKPSDNLGSQIYKLASWLVVFDNADEPDLSREYLDDLDNGSVLVTSRHPGAGKLWPQQLAIEVQLFNEKQSLNLFRRVAQPDEWHEDIAREIVGALDGWPLAITQMASFIRRKFLPLPEFLEYYRNAVERQVLHHEQADSVRGSSRGTMTTIVMPDFTEPASNLLGICAMSDPDCIQERMFKDFTSRKDVPKSQIAYVDARAELLSQSLLRRNTDQKELYIHRVIQDTIRNKMTAPEAIKAFSDAVDLVCRALNIKKVDERDNSKMWRTCEGMSPHVSHLKDLFEKHLAHLERGPFRQFAWSLNEAAWWQRESGNTKILESLLKLAKDICEDLRRENVPHDDTLDLLSDIYHSLGAWSNETNRAAECSEYNEVYLKMRLDAIPAGASPDIRTAEAYNQYGTGLMMVKDYEKAKVAFRSSIQIYKDLGAEPCADSLPVVNSGVALWLTHDLVSASDLLESGSAARAYKYDKDDTDSFRTGRFSHTLGNSRYSQNRSRESQDYHERASSQYQASIGTHHRTADVCHKVAAHYIRGSRFGDAESSIDQASKIWHVDAGSFAQEIARTTFSKSVSKERSGEVESAMRLRTEAIEMRRQILTKQEDGSDLTDEVSEQDFDELVAFWSR